MPLPSPNLDDRSFEQLMQEARALVARSDCGWTDLSAGDPGAVLLEIFAYLTSLMLYRLNRVPEKVHVELLRLIGVKLAPPAAARASLRFAMARAASAPVVIAAGTRVTAGRWTGGEPPVFSTLSPATIPAGATEVEGVPALHCASVAGELAGTGTGLAGQWVQAAQAPLIAPTGDDLDLVVGVEASPDELAERVPSLSFEGRSYRIWRAVDHFTPGDADDCCYVADRHAGRIVFAPAVRTVIDDNGRLSAGPETLGRVPAAGRAIRLWYRHGGGEAGNLPAGSLSVLRDPIQGVTVTQPEPASGGAAAETVDNAMLRGPSEMHSLRRAVTARDFEAVALRSSAAVARAKAHTQAQLWRHAPPGTVEILLVPKLGAPEQRGAGTVNREALQTLESDEVRTLILDAVEQRRPLGTACRVSWVRYKTVTVRVRVVVYRGEDADAVRARVLNRLHLVLNPLPTPLQRQGWPFGEPLRASHVYDIVLAERGVNYVDQVRFVVDEVPGREVLALARDPIQPATWYAASEQTLFRSLNDADGWEPAGRFEGSVDNIAVHPDKAGLLAISTQAEGSARLYVSRDCGETWRQAADFAFPVNDLAWARRGEESLLMAATDKGLYELSLAAGATPLQLVVDPAQPTGGFYAVVAFVDGRGGSNVAVAAREQRGVFLSRTGGATETFKRIHDGDEDIRVLGLQRLGMSFFLWAGMFSAGNESGKGCLRWELPSSPQSVESPGGWSALPVHWQGGSCRALAFDGERVFAGTHSAGVSVLDSSKPDAGWTSSSRQCGLPMREDAGAADKLFEPVPALAVSPGSAVLLAGGPSGVFRSADAGQRFEPASSTEFTEKVVLPPTWLFCSGAHDVQVVGADDLR
jgi:hypothetical protein